MNFDELNRIVAEEAGVHICPICSVPFDPRHKTQKTCGAKECQRLYKNRYLKKRRERLMEEDIDAWRECRADEQRKSRRKKKALEVIDTNLERLQNYWDAQQEKHIETDGLEYGKKQKERTLAQVPKIDLSGFERSEK